MPRDSRATPSGRAPAIPPALLSNLPQFVEVARAGNISKAAQALFVSQPALTARLHALEADIGQPLFVRTRRGVTLTDAGSELLPHAERALAAVAEGAAAARDAARGTGGSMIVAATPAVSAAVLPGALRRVRDSFPQVRLGVRTGHSEQIVDLVLREEVKLGLVRDLRHPDLERVPLYDDPLVFVVPPDHPFASLQRIPLDALRDQQLVLFDHPSSYHDLTDAMFRTAAVTPRRLIELDNIDAARRMVEQGLGVALLPRTSVAEGLGSGSLVRVPIADARVPRRRIVAIRRRGAGPVQPREELFLRAVRELGQKAARAKRPGARREQRQAR